MPGKETILEGLVTAREEGTLSDRLRDLAHRYCRSHHVTFADAIRQLARAAGIEPDTVRAILRRRIKHPPDERLVGFASVLADVTEMEKDPPSPTSARSAVRTFTFDEVWRDIEEIIGDGLQLETLSRRAPNFFRYQSDGIQVETGHGTETLPREWFRATWELLSERPVSEEDLPRPARFRSSAVATLFSTLPYVDYTTHPRITLFLVSHVFMNAQLSETFGVGPQGGIRFRGSAKEPKLILFITEVGISREDGPRGDNPYLDRWKDGILYYTGEGRQGDQTLSKGNRALHVSSEVGCPVYGFAKRAPDRYEYLGRFRVVRTETAEQKDVTGAMRTVFVFHMEPTLEKRGTGASSTQAWLFQANPSVFDLTGAIAELGELTFVPKQHANRINVGDTIYLWESQGGDDSEAGVVGVARVVSAAQPMEMSPDELRFVRDPERIGGVQHRVRLRIIRVLPARISRTQLMEHPILRDLTILKQWRQTAYPLTPEQADALEELIGGDETNGVDDQVQSTATIQGSSDSPSGLLAFEVETSSDENWDWQEQMDRLIRRIESTGFVFEPWQVAAYVTALRTKPFVILAGISGTGKSRLPQLVAQACGFQCDLLPVRPDWTDSSELLGYTDLANTFRPRPFLEIAEKACQRLDQGFVIVLDEMNLARVEHYFAEVLSRIEDRRKEGTRWVSRPLVSGGASERLDSGYERWLRVGLPPNLFLVGTVNMDESTHGFSRKVLDRAFTLELSDVKLGQWGRPETASTNGSAEPGASRTSAGNGGWDESSADSLKWPVSVMIPQYTTLADVTDLIPDERAAVDKVVAVLERLNGELKAAQLQVGYRVRDEIALFVMNAMSVSGSFVASDGEKVDPLDLAISMKVLPRIIGGSGAVRRVLRGVLAWAVGRDRIDDANVDDLVDRWREAGRPAAMAGYPFPRCAARLCLMWERLADDGFTSYWL